MKKFLVPEYLAVYVALMALLASQFPPLKDFFARPRLEIKLDGGEIYHDLGQIEWFSRFSVSNTGDRSALISSIRCRLTVDGQVIANMNATKILDDNGSLSVLPTISVAPSETFQIPVLCLQEMPNDFFDIVGNLRNNDPTNNEAVDLSEACSGRTEALDEDLVTEAAGIVAKYISLIPGETKLEIFVFDSDGRELGNANDMIDVTLGALNDFMAKEQFRYTLAPSVSCNHSLRW